MRNRKPRVYFLSDIGGGQSAVVAVSSMRQVLELVPGMEARRIMRDTAVGAEAERLAMGKPGQLYVRPHSMPSSTWRPSQSRHPAYVEATA